MRPVRTGHRRRALPYVLWCIAAFAAFGGAVVGAHEIGTTRVAIAFARDLTYRVEIVTDASALVEKLESASASSTPTGDLAARLGALDETFRRRIALAFDDVDASPVLESTMVAAAGADTPPTATIVLSGQVPPGAQSFTWQYSWTFASYALTVSHGARSPTTEWLEGGQRSSRIAVISPEAAVRRFGTAWQYLWLGFTHIVPKGTDHVLFVIGLFLLNRRLRPLLLQVSAFTVAHSLTLALSMLGAVNVSPTLVEPLIAVSIAYVAVENLFVADLKRWRVGLVFAFGLLHGFGFAGVLRELGLPASQLATALLTFNVGVEAGQLAVIAAAFLLVGRTFGACDWYRQRIVVPASLTIASVAVYWTIERLPL